MQKLYQHLGSVIRDGFEASWCGKALEGNTLVSKVCNFFSDKSFFGRLTKAKMAA